VLSFYGFALSHIMDQVDRMTMSWIPRFILMLVAIPAFMAAQGNMVSGPMLGHQAKREATIWLETEGAKHVTLTYWPSDQPELKKSYTKRRLRPTPIAKQPLKFILPLLEPGQSYDYSIIIDKVLQKFDYPLTFKTQTLWEWREPPPQFSFLFGSCTYINDAAYDRPGTPYGRARKSFSIWPIPVRIS
jgi:alkaline phosphatase D